MHAREVKRGKPLNVEGRKLECGDAAQRKDAGVMPNNALERTVGNLAACCGGRRSLMSRSAWSAAQLGR